MNPFGVESHDISKALTPAEKKQKKQHQNRAIGNLVGGVAGIGTATTAAAKAQDHGFERDSYRNLGNRRNYEADSIKSEVEFKAKNGRINPTQAARKGKDYRELKQIAGTYKELAHDSAKAASRSKKVAVGAGVVGAGLYANGIKHAYKHDKLEAKGRQRVAKSAFGVEH